MDFDELAERNWLVAQIEDAVEDMTLELLRIVWQFVAGLTE